MCGVFAAFSIEKPLRINSLQKKSILNKLFLRGPDNQSFVNIDDNCCLAHTRLSIIDPKHSSDQPMSNLDKTIWVVFNGEIYNYKELRKLTPDYQYKTNGDTEVILALYQSFGNEFVSKLRGMFSIVIYDKNLKKIISIVDRFGIKPLYYHLNEGTIYISSRIDVINIFNKSAKLNTKAVGNYFLNGELFNDQNTFFSDVFCLTSAQILSFDGFKVDKKSYWDKSSFNEEMHFDNYNDLLDNVDNILYDSIKLHRVSDVEVALNLSSGLDSNFFRMVMSSQNPESEFLRCYSYCFNNPVFDDSIDFKKYDNNQFQFNTTNIDAIDIIDNLEKTILATEGPVGGMGMIGFWMNMRDARKDGIKVMMSGQGADELFAGYQYYINNVSNESKKHIVLASDGTSLGVADYVNKEYFGEVLISNQETFFDSSLKNLRYLDLTKRKIPKLLMWQDKLAMDHSIETRVPYLDHKVFESLFHIPKQFLIQGKTTKVILRDVAKRYAQNEFDIELCDTKKKYMPTPQREWFKKDFYHYTVSLIESSLLHKIGMIDKFRLKKSYQEYVKNPHSDNSYFIWKFINTELFFRLFFK